MATSNAIRESFRDHQVVVEELSKNSAKIAEIAGILTRAIKKKKKAFLCGNGGSAADAQHVAAEFVGRFRRERRALSVIALTTDTSIMTSLGNDYSFEVIFSRQIEALAQRGDVVVGISTSGNSKNILQAVKKARARGCTTIGLSGKSGGKLKNAVDVCLRVPSDDTARIQEAHILIWHIITELVEKEFSRA